MSDYDEIEADKRRHAQREAEEWARDREATNRMWRESELRRNREQWESTKAGMPMWDFVLAGQGGQGEAYDAFLNGRKAALVMVIHRRGGRSDIVIFTTEDPGTLNVHYPHGRAPDQRAILDAFQKQIGDGR
jgi:hypothetical protein